MEWEDPHIRYCERAGLDPKVAFEGCAPFSHTARVRLLAIEALPGIKEALWGEKPKAEIVSWRIGDRRGPGDFDPHYEGFSTCEAAIHFSEPDEKVVFLEHLKPYLAEIGRLAKDIIQMSSGALIETQWKSPSYQVSLAYEGVDSLILDIGVKSDIFKLLFQSKVVGALYMMHGSFDDFRYTPNS